MFHTRSDAYCHPQSFLFHPRTCCLVVVGWFLAVTRQLTNRISDCTLHRETSTILSRWAGSCHAVLTAALCILPSTSRLNHFLFHWEFLFVSMFACPLPRVTARPSCTNILDSEKLLPILMTIIWLHYNSYSLHYDISGSCVARPCSPICTRLQSAFTNSSSVPSDHTLKNLCLADLH